MDKLIHQLLEKLLNGECSRAEELILDEWYNSFDQESDPQEMLDDPARHLLEELTLRRINEKITRLEENGFLLTGQPKRFASNKPLIYALTGIAALLFLVMGLLFIKKNKPAEALQTLWLQKVKYRNDGKNLLKIVLSDKSIVWLSPKSSIELFPVFEKRSRNVRLNGMAFFQITKNKERPFIITTNFITTKVWGTSFSVNAYPDSSCARVSVLTGKVSVSVNNLKDKGSTKKTRAVILLPYEKVTYFTKKQTLVKAATGTDEDINIFKKTNLSFHNAKMSAVINSLNHAFNVHIIAADPKIINYQFMADLTNQDLPSILEILKTSLEVNYEINANDITLRSNN